MLRRDPELAGHSRVHSAKFSGVLQLRSNTLAFKPVVYGCHCQRKDNQTADKESREIIVPSKPKPKEVESVIAAKIRALRESLGMTQTAFASAVGVRPNSVSQWESGKNKPNPDMLVRLSALADGIDKLFFLGHAGIPDAYFEGGAMISEILDASTKIVAKSLSGSTHTFGGVFDPEGGDRIPLLKQPHQLGEPNAAMDYSLPLPSQWLPRESTVQAVRLTEKISPFMEGELIALVDTSRRDPDRLTGCIVMVKTQTGVEPMTLRKESNTYILVPLHESQSNPVRLFHAGGDCHILGRVIRWVAEAPSFEPTPPVPKIARAKKGEGNR
jgi:transcriptional regulator with XRE-family HTH domain